MTIEGVVIGDFQPIPNDTRLSGFFLQEEDADADADPATSEGLFIFCSACPTNVAEGQRVQVTGTVSEFFNSTQITATTAGSVVITNAGNNLAQVTPATIDLPVTTATIDEFYERIESMLVTYVDTLTVAEYFEQARYGLVELFEGGRPRQFTEANPPSAAGYAAQLDTLNRRRVQVDDDDNVENSVLNLPNGQQFVFHPQANGGLSVGTQGTDFFRGGDLVSGLTGVLHWSFAGGTSPDAWRIRPTAATPATFTVANPRPAAPPAVGGAIRAASVNVLNYFTTLNVRGADSTAELNRQRERTSIVLCALNADVAALMEIENHATNAAITDLLGAVNTRCGGANPYTFVNTGGALGTDEIRVLLIYRTGTLSPVGAPLADLDPVHNRPPTAQTFDVVDAANPAFGQRFTTIANHSRSKGCGGASGADLDQIDGQSCFAATRESQANRLLTWVNSTVVPAAGDPDVLLLGDFNAYAQETATTTITAGGYTDLETAFLGASAYSYLSEGQLGHLDYAFSSSSLTPQITGINAWHINADENPLFDYNDEIDDGAAEQAFEEKPDGSALVPPRVVFQPASPYRASDHDPVIVGLFAIADVAVTKADSPDPVTAGTNLTYTVTVTNNGPDAAATVAWSDHAPGRDDLRVALRRRRLVVHDAGRRRHRHHLLRQPVAGRGECRLHPRRECQPLDGRRHGSVQHGNRHVHHRRPESRQRVRHGEYDRGDVGGSVDRHGRYSGSGECRQQHHLRDHAHEHRPEQRVDGDRDRHASRRDDLRVALRRRRLVVHDAGRRRHRHHLLRHPVTGRGDCRLHPRRQCQPLDGRRHDSVQHGNRHVHHRRPGPGNESDTATTTVATSADLSIVTIDTPDPVSAGSNLTYTITLTNTGPSDASTVTVTDTVPAGATFVSLSAGAGWSCTTPAVGGTGTISCANPSLAVGSAVFTLVVNVNPSTAGGTVLSNTATATSTTTDPSPGNESDTESTTVATSADLSIVMVDSPDPVNAGSNLTYAITLSNAGPTNASTVTVTDAVPAGTTFVSLSAGAGWSCTTPAVGGTGTISCANPSMAVGNAAFTLVVNVNPSTAGGTILSNTATVTSTASDTVLTNNSASASTLVNSRGPTACDVNGDGRPEFITGAGPGGLPHVRMWSIASGGLTEPSGPGFLAYDSGFSGGVFVACRDLTGDGVAELITGAGPGGGPHVRVFSLAGGSPTEVASFFAYNPAFAGGIAVAAGDVTGDGVAELITGAGPGGSPHVRVFSLAGGSPTEVASFYAYDPAFAGGISVAAGDVTGDGVAEIITGAGPGGGPHVRAFSLAGGVVTEVASFYAYDPAFAGGVSVAAGDVTGDGVAEFIIGAGPGGGPHVRALSLAGGVVTEVASFYAYDPAFAGGISVAAGDVTGDGIAELITGAGPSGGPHVRVWSADRSRHRRDRRLLRRQSSVPRRRSRGEVTFAGCRHAQLLPEEGTTATDKERGWRQPYKKNARKPGALREIVVRAKGFEPSTPRSRTDH